MRMPASAEPTEMEWRYYASDAASSKFSPADQIDKFNVRNLKVAWKWDSIDNAIPASRKTAYNEATPIMVEGVVYTSTSLNQVAAIEPATGKTIWKFDPMAYVEGTPPNSGFVHRGVSYWSDGAKKRILYGTNEGYLLSIDAATGVLDKTFGNQGSIDLTQGLYRAVQRKTYAVTSPVMICRDTVIVGSSISDFARRKRSAPGDVRGFDVRSGEIKWTFHTIPQAGERGVDT
jgi:quinoprotein glucose dehydrogenase